MLATDRLATSVSRVTGTMLGLVFRPGVAIVRPEPWRTVVLNIPGLRPVAVAMSSDRHGCGALAAAMLGIPAEDLDLPMIDDFMRELVNMTAGQIKSELRLDQVLGLPRVVDGEPMFAGAGEWTHHILDSDAISLVVSFASKLV